MGFFVNSQQSTVKNSTSGFSLVEVIIGMSLIMLSLVGLTGAYSFYLKVGLKNTDSIQSVFLLQEGAEAVTLMRDDAWSNLSGLTSGTWYYLAWNGTAWMATSTATTTNGVFTRTFKLDDVYRRNSDKDIVDAGSGDSKTLDANTKKLTVRVTAGEISTTSVLFTDATTDGSLGSFPSNNAGDGDVAQSFTTDAATTTVGGVGLYLKRVGNPSNVYLEIRGGSTVGTVLGTSATVASTTIPSSALSWVTFTFPGGVTLGPNTVYYLRLRSIPESTVAFSGSSGTLNWGYRQTASSPYAGGEAIRYVGRLNNPSDQGQPLSQYDFGFQVTTTGGGIDKTLLTYIANLFE